MKTITNTTKSPRIDWLFGGNPNAIERQESEGQQELIKSSQLPRKINFPRGIDVKEKYESLGIKVVSNTHEDDLFFDVILPDGWQLKATDHSMWNNLIDNTGKIIATIFYKAAFYDRAAFVNFD